jgi:hypothetical protein
VITFDPVTPAPLSVRVVRALIPFTLFFGYLLGRAYPAADGRIPLAEAIVAGVVLIGLVFAGLVALGDLIYPATPRARRRAASEDLEITAVHAPIADAQTVVAATYAAEVARLDALIEDTQPFTPLFTHDYDPQHHTPPGGFRVPDMTPVVTGGKIRWIDGGTTELDAATAQHVLRGELFEVPDTGRHHVRES